MFNVLVNQILKPFARSTKGGIATYMALAMIPFVGIVGIGTDVARGFMVKSRLASAVDAAALAGGKAFFKPTRDEDVTMFFNANFPAGYMGAAVNGPNWIVDEAAETITVTASATLPTTFMKILERSDLTVKAEAEVTRQMQMLDVVLSIDMSGSMGNSAPGGGSRIAAARGAATDLVNILFGDDAEKELLTVGLVPWNGKVNVMTDKPNYDPDLTTSAFVPVYTNPLTGSAETEVFYANVSPVPLFSAPPDNWKGCVFSRFIDDDDPLSDADNLEGPAEVPLADWPAWEPVGPEGEPVSGWQKCDLSMGGECTPCLSHGITPLTNVKATILGEIGALLNPKGTTNITQGLGWAWRVLTPEAPFTEAVADPPYLRQQAVVLLSDGENYPGHGDGYKRTFGGGSDGREEMDARLLALAENMKADGIIIYVVQFANAGTGLQDLLQQVASGPVSPFYHYAPDANALKAVFHEVANHLSELRISK
ncbi:MAG: pilus assembly protein TadG-related protein [Magnetovibrionaceae bacterium]